MQRLELTDEQWAPLAHRLERLREAQRELAEATRRRDEALSAANDVVAALWGSYDPEVTVDEAGQILSKEGEANELAT